MMHVTRALFAGALLAATAVVVAGPAELVLANLGPGKLSLYLDPLSVLMLGLVTFLGMIVSRYSFNYLAGDPGQARFSRWLVLTLASVSTLVISSNLLMFALAWVATSLSLHKLLLFYPERVGAVLAAKKKFIVSRIGDVCLLAALLLVWQVFGTWDFQAIFAASTQHQGEPAISWICGLLVAVALIKSAQFPFHSWLPDTLETPTPVSALMHAGIINAGGFLVVRLSPLIAQSPGSLNALALVGAFTALFASVIMMTQTSIKKSLAWSTVAQMGFMMLQCGLGAFALAMLHIVAHSLYKAHAFLSSGSIVNIAKSAWVPTGRPAAHPLIVLSSLGVAVAVGCGMGALFGLQVSSDLGHLMLVAVFVMALAHMLWTLWSSSMVQKLLLWGLLITTAATAVCFGLHSGSEHLLAGVLPEYAPARSGVEYAVMAVVGLLFLAVLIFQSQLPLWATRPAFARFYVHASNGFYLGTLFGRLVQKKLSA
ncbi:proton-conducting transporter membrane subunit [Prosthecobacter sp.]|uniref:proton-conducting transporter transmembrane domain-containing protein n=1 Tax=Prosthecobacter sp. TaxID=1965333 RepID=UPI001DAB4BC6|nr:proton-conducting transporter membrane subunit [Prosthecobacter sp.]MCB1279323.1 hypothetical protein [Prosthecobacter sp.]